MPSRYGQVDRDTLVDVVAGHVETQPDGIALTALAEGRLLAELSYEQLWTATTRLAGGLLETASPGDRVALVPGPGLEFPVAFLACLRAGLVAVPMAPPRRRDGLEKIAGLLRDCEASLLLTGADSPLASRLEGLPALVPGLQLAPAGELARGPARDLPRPDIEDLAFLQYTSGSTGSPKGVIVRHRHLHANAASIDQRFRVGPESRSVAWLPLFHDMGLVGTLMQFLFAGAQSITLPPAEFVRRPVAWLEAISRYQGTVCGGPDFGFAACVDSVSDEELAGLDLSSWSVAFCGAEPIRPSTLERFTRRFEACGFDPKAWLPCYGMAETTLFACGTAFGREPRTLTVETSALERGWAQPGESGTALVSCGRPGDNVDLAIVDPETRRLAADGRCGEIWVSAPQVTSGYWQRDELSDEVFRAALDPPDGRAWLRTGDLGLLSEGELFVTGRLKDLIILRGRNIAPQDLEMTAEAAHPELSRGGVIALGIDEGEGERVVIAAELPRRPDASHEEIALAIAAALAAEHDASPSRIAFLSPATLPKTSSGKHQRRATKLGLLEGSLRLVGDWRPPRAAEGLSVPAPPSSRRIEDWEDWLADCFASLVGQPAEDLRLDEPFAAYGLDSLRAAELSAELSTALDTEIDPTVFWQHATIAELASHLRGLPGRALA